MKKALILCLIVLSSCSRNSSLVNEFVNPPQENRPEVWWWFDKSAPDEAITRDLEGLSRVGIAGFTIYDIKQGYATDSSWVRKVRWAFHEASRLGLDGFLCIGCAGCGHPDTSMEHARKGIVYFKEDISGGSEVRITFPEVWRDVACFAVPLKEEGCPDADDILDLSGNLDKATGQFVWTDAPEGKWTIVRFGYAPNGMTEAYNGCFIDHLSREAFDEHWGHAVQPLLDAMDESERSAFKGVMCDSWERGRAEWTQDFEKEFLDRRGYDIKKWLPVLAGIELGDASVSAKFKRDYEETVSELLAENHYEYQKEVANRHGLLSVAEAAGPHQWQGDVRRMQGKCDVSMGEFWMPSNHRPLDPQRFMLRDAANAAHVYGIKEVLAESFTTINTYWVEYPHTMKPCADRAFCDGLTRVCYHGMMLSPSLEDKPGYIRNVGTMFNPQTTWFDQSAGFNLYLSRCSRMLSEGRFNADCLIYAGDAVKLFSAMKTPSEALGEGYDYDYCPTELLMEASVDNGEVVLPSGMRYKVLKLSERNPETAMNMKPGYKESLPDYPEYHYPMTLPAVEKILELVNAGAVLLGERPEGPVSMNDSKEAFDNAAEQLWGDGSESKRKVGNGYVFTDREELLSWLSDNGCGKDFETSCESIDWIHRTTDGGDIYFVSNQSDSQKSFTARFRSGGTKAQLWNPVTGKICNAKCSKTGAGGSEVQLELPSYGSVFVVFGSPRAKENMCHDGISHESADFVTSGPWTLSFDSNWGGPAEPVVMDVLKDWTSFDDPGIRYYSGTAVYSADFELPEGWDGPGEVKLDLGEMKNIADVSVNGVYCGTAWTKPFSVSLESLKPGTNRLEIKVTNLWPNRLIYDSSLPEEQRLTRTNRSPYTISDQPLPSGLLGPLKLVRE